MGARPVGSARNYLVADSRRTIQISLGLIWLLDGALQLQSFMYDGGFITALKAASTGQPPWVADSVNWTANTMQSQQALLNTLVALAQIWLGMGLLNHRTVKPALAVSLAWSLLVWWFGEGFGMLFMSMSSPLSGAPGAAILYLMVALVVWRERPGGHGLMIAVILAAVSAAIGIAVARNWHPTAFLGLSVFINLVFWIVGQGFGGIFTGAATDPNSAPLLCLLACALYALIRQPAYGPRSGV